MAIEMPKITIHDIASGEIIERPMTEAEMAEIQNTFPDAFLIVDEKEPAPVEEAQPSTDAG